MGSLFFIGNWRSLPCKEYAYDEKYKNCAHNGRPQKSSNFTPRIRLKGDSCHRAALPCKRWHQVSFFLGNATKEADNVVDRIKQHIDNVQKAERRMGGALPRWSWYLVTCGTTTRDWIASRCVARRKSMRNGSCSAWYTTLKNARITTTCSNETAIVAVAFTNGTLRSQTGTFENSQ